MKGYMAFVSKIIGTFAALDWAAPTAVALGAFALGSKMGHRLVALLSVRSLLDASANDGGANQT